MKTLFNDGWEFTKQPLHTTYEAIMEKQKEFEPVGLPMIGLYIRLEICMKTVQDGIERGLSGVSKRRNLCF